MTTKKTVRAGFIVAASAATLVCAVTANAQTPEFTRLEQNGLKMQIAPLFPDQIRGFYLGRGFAADLAEIAVQKGCIFRSSIGSSYTKADDPAITISLTDWRVVPENGKPASMMTREIWDKLWKAKDVSEEAAVAAHWALFPTKQTFGPTDYNWGFLTFGLAPGTKFSLVVKWQSAGKGYSARMENLSCGK